MTFRDHHRYTAADIDRLAELGRRHGCDAFVTTAKDEVKLDAAMRLRLNAVAPLRTARWWSRWKTKSAVLAQLRLLGAARPTLRGKAGEVTDLPRS